jgi:hypothetical protein
MGDEHTRQTALFPDLLAKPLHVSFSHAKVTSDGGAVLLAALDDSLGLTAALAGCLVDHRQAAKVCHPLDHLVRQRVIAMACGYSDANDASGLRSDPLHKVLVGLDPERDPSLASQPTLSRFENSVSAATCFRMAASFTNCVLDRHAKRLRRRKVRTITIDLDGSVDPTHGQQEFTFFNRYYDTWCYFPLFGFLTFNDEPEQYLFAAILRSGVSKEVEGTLGLLRRVVPRIRELFPRSRVRVRLDAGFQGPQLFDLLDALGVEYLVGFARNSVLGGSSAAFLKKAIKEAKATGETTSLYGETQYSARSWKKTTRRVVFKAECLISPFHDEPKGNERYVVTNLPWTPKNVYKEYCRRGDAENRVKELKDGLEVDRTSCHRAIANQFRLLLTAAAFALYQELRLRAARTPLARAQVGTLRLALIKIGGVVKRSCRRITLELSRGHPWAGVWHRIARACGAVAPV